MQLSLFSLITPIIETPGPAVDDQMYRLIAPKIPEAAIQDILLLIRAHPFQLKIVRHRTSKTGDFRAAHKNEPARITVNGNLNKYAFLITLVHELAHHHVNLDFDRKLKKITLRRKSRPLPHGKEWKDKFRLLMGPYLNLEVFPIDILPVLNQYLENPKASSSVDHHLSTVLNRYDPADMTIRLEELPYDAVFTIHDTRYFRKKEKLRKRYRCICLKTNRIYLVSANAPVKPIGVRDGKGSPNTKVTLC